MMFELGKEDRLSSIAWVRATMIRVCSQVTVDPRYEQERRVFNVAKDELSSPETISSVDSLLPEVLDVLDWIAAAGRLHKARKRN